jgi:hypothetical protein
MRKLRARQLRIDDTTQPVFRELHLASTRARSFVRPLTELPQKAQVVLKKQP